MTASWPGPQEKVEDNCDRCGCPVEAPFRYADEICGLVADRVSGVCDHVPLCLSCHDRHKIEVGTEAGYALGSA